ncbi:MAG: 50S ribosomal protein L10 [Alphaproteobacteria bacterium]|jgi:large subunit ribosomal protein L10|nr:50S ribosomal protein L10 [Alphaproteobacteria bacterium]
MDRAQKREMVGQLSEVFSQAGVVVVAHYTGLTVADMTQLRSQIRDAGANFKVVKNRLAKIALHGTPMQGIAEKFNGPTAIAYSNDPVAAPKVVTQFAKKNDKLVVLGAALGNTVLDLDGVKALVDMPPIEDLRSKLLGLLQAPASKLVGLPNAPAQKLVGVLPAPGSQLARVFQAYSSSQAA